MFALPSDLGDHLVRGVAKLADGVIGCSLPRWLIILDAAIAHDHAAGDVHARAGHEPEFNGVTHANVSEPRAARDRDAGDAGAQHLLHVACRLERGEFRPRRASAFALALDDRIAVGDVAMRIDEPGHDPLSTRVDHLDTPAILERDVGRKRAHALDAVALDNDGVVARRRPAGAVDQGAVADHQGFAHGSLPLALSPEDVTPKPAGISTAMHFMGAFAVRRQLGFA